MVISPLTNSSDITLIKTIDSEQLINDWKNSVDIDITEEIHKYQEIQLYKCNQTGLRFFYPFDIAGSGQLYAQLQNFDWYYMSNKWEHKIALQNLSGCSSILEIGSGSGSFVKLATNLGFNIKGIELNKTAVNIAKNQGLDVDYINLREAANLYRDSMDVVCSFQVLEHVPNPKEFINWSIEVLKPGGKLIYCVPNANSFLKYQYNLMDMPPHHMHQWSKATFKSLEKIFPIKLEKTLNEPLANYHISGYLDSYGNHFREASLGGKMLFNRLSIPLYKRFLNLGWRRFLTGQSLYVQFRKV